jgi:hypothetical protein
VLDTNHEQAQKRAKEFGVPKVYDRLEQLIAECDIVDVRTPPASHAAIAERDRRSPSLVMEKPVDPAADWERIAPKLAGEHQDRRSTMRTSTATRRIWLTEDASAT